MGSEAAGEGGEVRQAEEAAREGVEDVGQAESEEGGQYLPRRGRGGPGQAQHRGDTQI